MDYSEARGKERNDLELQAALGMARKMQRLSVAQLLEDMINDEDGLFTPVASRAHTPVTSATVQSERRTCHTRRRLNSPFSHGAHVETLTFILAPSPNTGNYSMLVHDSLNVINRL